MKAIVQTQYGPPDVLQLKEVAKPTPKEDQVLIKVQAASVNYSDWVYVRGKPFVARLMGSGLLKPKNFTQNEQRYDLILDIKAYRSISDYERVLDPKGIHVLTGGSVARILQAH